jgi:F-type H+-transporting ATPase subunit delta
MIARRYAMALLELSLKENSSGTVRREIISLSNMMKQKRYFKFFTDRLVKSSEKLEALNSLSPLTRDFMRLVIANKREEYIDLISREYVELLNQKENVVDGIVSSRMPLSAEQKTRIKDKLEEHLAKKINLSYRTDKKIIGGVRVQYGSKVIDGTVSGMLKDLLAQITVK